METVDDEFLDQAAVFIKEKAESETPFFVWFNTTHMHFRTHVKPESKGQAGRWQSDYHDVMIDHDRHVGRILALLDDLSLAEDTIVVYSTDNGPHMNSWPDAGMTPFRGEKNSNWEGGYRVPALVRWPAHIPAHTVLNGIMSHNDWFTDTARRRRCQRHRQTAEGGGGPERHVLPGASRRPQPAAVPDGQDGESPRNFFFYVNDDGDLTAVRYDNWKMVFLEQRVPGTLQVWAEPFTELRCPRSSTCGPTPTSERTSRRTPTGTGCSIMRSCLSPPRHSWPRWWPRSSSSRLARSRPPSASSKHSTSYVLASPAHSPVQK